MITQYRPRLDEDEYKIILEHRKKTQPVPDTQPNKIPKYLVLDIETLPIIGYFWGLFKQRIPYTNIIKDWCVLSWKAKWLYDSSVMGAVLTPDEVLIRDDSRILREIWMLLEQADVVIAHNGNRFDIPKLNARFWFHKMTPPTSYLSIDTYKASDKVLATSSHKLDYLGQYIARKGKLETDFNLWVRCDHGEQEALNYMFDYNEEDVLLLEEVYLELRPWIRPHPNYSILSEADYPCCVYCGSRDLNDVGHYVTSAGRFLTKRCGHCGGVMRSRVTDITKKQRDHLSIPLGR